MTEKRRIEAIRKINISSENKLAYDQNRPSRYDSNNSGLTGGLPPNPLNRNNLNKMTSGLSIEDENEEDDDDQVQMGEVKPELLLYSTH